MGLVGMASQLQGANPMPPKPSAIDTDCWWSESALRGIENDIRDEVAKEAARLEDDYPTEPCGPPLWDEDGEE